MYNVLQNVQHIQKRVYTKWITNDTCAWTPNKFEQHCLRVARAGWLRLLAAGLCKSRQLGDDGKSWHTGYWQLG